MNVIILSIISELVEYERTVPTTSRLCTYVLGPRAVHHDEKKTFVPRSFRGIPTNTWPTNRRFASIGDKVVDVCTSLLILS
jgi:hypothetical protein